MEVAGTASRAGVEMAMGAGVVVAMEVAATAGGAGVVVAMEVAVAATASELEWWGRWKWQWQRRGGLERWQWCPTSRNKRTGAPGDILLYFVISPILLGVVPVT